MGSVECRNSSGVSVTTSWPDFHQRDAGAEQQGFAQVVGDEDDCLSQALLQGQEFALQFGAGDGIERAERLVHQEKRRIGGQSAGHADSLPLSA